MVNREIAKFTLVILLVRTLITADLPSTVPSFPNPVPITSPVEMNENGSDAEAGACDPTAGLLVLSITRYCEYGSTEKLKVP